MRKNERLAQIVIKVRRVFDAGGKAQEVKGTWRIRAFDRSADLTAALCSSNASTGGSVGDDVPAATPGQFRGCPNPVRLNVAIHEQLLAAVDGRRGVAAADRLWEACVVLLDIDAAAISLVFDGASSGTLGSSGAPARTYDELQFTLGEGPCLDSVARRIPILVVDLADPGEGRWPA